MLVCDYQAYYLTLSPTILHPKALLLTAGLALAGTAAHAQINININTAPPVVVGAPADAQYYYIPKIGGYYDLPAHRYLVQRNGRWKRLDGYDPRNFHPQHIEYRGAEPWLWKGKGHPHGMPPGQAKKLYGGPGKGKGHGHGHH